MSTTTLTSPPLAAHGTRPNNRRAAHSTREANERAVWLGFVVVIAASVMDLLDSTIAQTAAPAIRRSLGGSYADLEWISAGLRKGRWPRSWCRRALA